MRRQAWWAFMAGGFFTYGHKKMWLVEEGWLDALESLGAGQMIHFKNIANLRPWWTMVPDQGVFLDGAGTGRTLNTALRAADETCLMIYLSSQCHALVNLSKIRTHRARATLFNPVTGEQKEAGVYETGNEVGDESPAASMGQWFSTPYYWEDAVLIVDAMPEK